MALLKWRRGIDPYWGGSVGMNPPGAVREAWAWPPPEAEGERRTCPPLEAGAKVLT